MPTGMPGGYSDWSFRLTPDAIKVFNEATKRLMVVKYEPIAFASQVVAGTNYTFLAKSQPVIPNPTVGVCKIHVFVPLPNQGEIELGAIDSIDP